MDPAQDLARAARQVEHLGFVVLDELPKTGGEARLVVALRPRPTRMHFDPELIGYWRTDEDLRGRPAELSIANAMPLTRPYSWGPIELLDRFGVENSFISLGGRLTADTVDGGTVVAVFRSPAPILRRGGHSQGYDALATAIGAFFGRILVPIDFEPGMEQLISRATPLVRYAAFLRYQAGGPCLHRDIREAYSLDTAVIRSEAPRLERDEPEAWDAGCRLLERMELVTA